MQFIPQEAYEYLQNMAGNMPGIWGLPASGTEEFMAWVEGMHAYSEATGAAGMKAAYFWLALQFPKDDYADSIEFHPDIPMLVPTSGTQPKILGVFGNREDVTDAMYDDKEHVHLLYKLKIQGSVAIRDFLEFMATHNMMEKAE